MSVYKIKNTWWVDIGVDGARMRKRSPENTRTGATAYEALLRGKIARGEPLKPPKPPQVPTFTEYSMTQWFPEYVCKYNKYSEQHTKRVTLRKHLIPFFGKIRIDSMTTSLIETYKSQKLKEGLSPKTINNHMGIVSICLRTAIDYELPAKLPKMKKLPVRPQSFDFLTLEECQQLLAATDDLFWYTAFLLVMKTGLRLGELIGLQWESVNLQQGILTVKRAIVKGKVCSPKSNHIRYIPLTADLQATLYRWRPIDYTPQVLVFTRRQSKPLDHKTLRAALAHYCHAAGLRKIGWHALRHTFASSLACLGVDLKAIQELMGHADIQTTMRYTHLSPSHLRSAIAALEPSSISNYRLRQHSDNQPRHPTLRPDRGPISDLPVSLKIKQKQADTPASV